VIHGTHSSTRQEYAIKVLDKGHLKRNNKLHTALAEKNTLVRLGSGHPGIVRLHWAFQDDWSLCKSPLSLTSLPRQIVAGHRDRGPLAMAEDFPSRPSWPRAASSRRSHPPPTLSTNGVVLLCVIRQQADTHALSLPRTVGDPIATDPR
jgi:serine/threonine protein kinase